MRVKETVTVTLTLTLQEAMDLQHEADRANGEGQAAFPALKSLADILPKRPLLQVVEFTPESA